MTEYDNIVVAAQEHAAKHAGAVYSPAEKWQMLYRQSVWLLCLL
jgi:formylmethanofuran dehydrogenase subunit D